MAIHEEFRNHIGSGLAMSNALIDIVNDGTYQAASTNVATWQAANNAKELLDSIHATDKALFQMANRYVVNLNAMDVYNDTDIAASNSTSTWEARFTANDPSFPAAYHGSRAR